VSAGSMGDKCNAGREQRDLELSGGEFNVMRRAF
jgi:hypothetical protein